MHLPDVNFWLALAFQAHEHHPLANTWMRSAGRQSCCICRITQMGFLRLATNPKVMLEDALTMHDAWRAYDQIYSDERVVFAEEPVDIELSWRTLTHNQTFSPKVWNDAYLAAFAQASGFHVLTFDKGFARYHGVVCTILS